MGRFAIGRSGPMFRPDPVARLDSREIAQESLDLPELPRVSAEVAAAGDPVAIDEEQVRADQGDSGDASA